MDKHIAIVSGSTTDRNSALTALKNAGFEPLEIHDHGLPSYPDPITAAAAGAPNSGHTPGTSHPAVLQYIVRPGDHDDCSDKLCEHVGQVEERPNPLEEHIGTPYESDPTVGFLAVVTEDVDGVQQAVIGVGWMLRAFSAPSIEVAHEGSAEDRLDAMQRQIDELRSQR